MTIESGASLDGAAGNIKTYGDWTNDGSFTASSGSVTMKGNSAQTIGGASSNGFYDLHIENDGSTVSLDGALDIQNVMYPEQGTFDVNGNALTLKSDAQAQAQLEPLETALTFLVTLLWNVTFLLEIKTG